MTPVTASRLPPWRRQTIIQLPVRYVTIIALCLLAHGALAQQQSESKPAQKRDDLDVTMQIIVDPDAKLPDEVVRRIPLPERKPAAPSAAGQQSASESDKQNDKQVDKQNKESGREAREVGRDVGQSAKESAKEAAEQARRAEAEDRRRERGNPDRPPGNPNPPGRPPRN